MAGRPPRATPIVELVLRIPPELLARIERCSALIQLQSGRRQTRTLTLEHLLEIGCSAVEADFQIPLHLSRVSEISEIPEDVSITEISESAEIPDAIEIEAEPERDVPAPAAVPVGARSAARGDMRRSILALLQAHPEGLSPSEMRAHLGVTKRLAHTCIAMARDGLLRRLGPGRYGVL